MRYDEIISEININIGDILDVSSDLFQMAKNCMRKGTEFDVNILIDTICGGVGDEGTVLIRTWNWDFCHGEPFHYKNTKSAVGALGNAALERAEFRRTKHPIYSFAVWGRYKDELCEMDNVSAWGADSPFGLLANNGGKQLMLGSTMKNSFTYVHYVEEQTGVSYRYLKEFTAGYTGEDEQYTVRTYKMNVRELSLDIKMTSEKFAPIFYERGVLTTKVFEGIEVSVVELVKAYPIIEDDIINNRSKTICSFIGQDQI